MTVPAAGRRVTVVESIPALTSRRAALGAAAGTVLAYAALFVCAVVPSWLGLILAAAATLGCEIIIRRYVPICGWALDRVGLGVPARGVVRGVAYVLFADREFSWHLSALTAAVVVLVAGANALRIGLRQVVDYLRVPPIMTRGLPVEAGPVPPALPASFGSTAGPAVLIELLAPAGLAISARDGTSLVAVLGLLLALLNALGVPAVLSLASLTLSRARLRSTVSAAAARAVLDYAPQVVAYFGNQTEWRYQIEMWLRTLERLDQRVVVLVRDREALRGLAPTSVPVLCIPGADTLMGLALPSVEVALYVGNPGNNVQLLRRPGLRSVFIGHGDSDKGASSNPFSRVYDEIWVAGAAGRLRYAQADIGVRPAAVVEVGRPQLSDLHRLPDAVPMCTVLYAPTWEGWGEDEFSSSLSTLGPDLIRALLARPGLRVMYRPHPRSGHRDPATRAADAEVTRLLRAAGATDSGSAVGVPPVRVAAGGGDLLDQMVRGRGDWSRAAFDAQVGAWNARYWAAHPGHRILTGAAPDLHACFAVTDVLVSDVSSVTSDFLAADRPYAIVNLTDEPEEEFRARTPSTLGGFVLDRGLMQLDPLLAAASGPDPTADARGDARRLLLGPRPADPAAPFIAAVDRITR